MKSARRQSYRMQARAAGMADTRERIVRAAVKLAFEQAYEDITLAAIAREANTSHQTVLNHFASKEGVAAAAAAAIGQETWAAREKARTGDTAQAIAVLVGEYERLGDVNARWALSAERFASVARLLDEARAGHQVWLERVFSAKLPKAPEARRRAIHALHAATDILTWKVLRRDLKLARAETERIMVTLVTGVLDGRSRRRRSRSRGRAR